MNKTSAKTSIGSIQPLVVKWTLFLLTLGVSLAAGTAFIVSGKSGYWVGLATVALLLCYIYFRTLNTANIYVLNGKFIVEHALRGTVTKDFSLYQRIESPYFYYKIVFGDGTQYYFFPNLTGVWQSFIRDSQGYSNYVREMIKE